MTDIHTKPAFSAEMWAAFWAAPEVSRIDDILADDIVGYWQGDPEPVRGRAAYAGKIAELITAIPDLALDLVDSATVDGSTPVEQLVSGVAPDQTGRSRSAVWTGSVPATESWSRTSSATTRSSSRQSEACQPGDKKARSAAE